MRNGRTFRAPIPVVAGKTISVFLHFLMDVRMQAHAGSVRQDEMATAQADQHEQKAKSKGKFAHPGLRSSLGLHHDMILLFCAPSQV